MNWNRILSVLLAVIYVIGAGMCVGGESAYKVGMFAILPLACIWFSEAMGGFIGQTGRGYITTTSPGLVVCIMGWILLLLPIITAIVSSLSG